MGSGGDSGGLLLAVVAIIAIVVLVVVLLLRKRSGASRPGGSVPDESSDGERPLYKDPDPENMAGGRTTSTPPGRSET
ncbi:MAG: hypothetical protein AVDCRST_MAG30-4611 [uncultured Solirubrobacteraceae bacterium]|uniref:Uncharacterized protein n=1 Tax=uncultured Solirubrobacteraceae bacterium TaxID=1162706 RepID=A0A6J4U4H5_9ACTN|nr:MAG: hypothetical protein AVDCRST_MAG30-4611 [uncultured Solirubrobacteraceae bacterium]